MGEGQICPCQVFVKRAGNKARAGEGDGPAKKKIIFCGFLNLTPFISLVVNEEYYIHIFKFKARVVEMHGKLFEGLKGVFSEQMDKKVY